MRFKSMVIIFFCLITHLAGAQNSGEPEFKWKVYYLEGNEKLVPLESLPYTKRLKSGVGKNKSLIEVRGDKSTSRFTTPPVFAIKVADNELDPDQQITLYKMEVKGGRRNTVLKSVGNISKTTALNPSEPLQFARYGDNCLLLTTDTLAPGEYGFFLPFSTNLFLFGVD